MSALNVRILPSASIPTIALHRITVDLFLGPVAIALVLLLSLLLPVPAFAQSAAGAAVDYAYQRSMARIVAGSAAGLQASSPTTMNILNAGKIVGSFAVTEKRLIDLASLARFARASTLPGIVALGGTYLLQYGLQKCADGTWCKPAQPEQTPNGGPYLASDGYWSLSWTGGRADGTLDYVCRAKVAWGGVTFDRIDAGGGCWAKYPNGTVNLYGTANHQAGCATGATLSNGTCYPSGYVPASPAAPAADADVETAWQGAMKANPFIQEQVWGFEDPATQNQQWADALAQLASVAAPASVTVTDPTQSTTTAAGTTKVDHSCTYSASGNADASTQKNLPASVGVTCTTVTTNPDGTKTTQTTQTNASPQGAPSVPTKVDIDTCGLPGKPACKIDETGTAAETDGKTKVTKVGDDLVAARTDAVQKMNDATKQTDFGYKMPTLLPGGSCQPIQFFKWKDFNGTVDLCEKLGFIRTLLSWLWGAGAAIYIYNRVSSANA